MRFVDDSVPDQDTEKDIPNVRFVHTRYGFSVRLERRDPYGLVYVVWNKGPVPDIISGAYSDFDRAREAVTVYLSNNTFNAAVDEPVEVEKLQFKKRFKRPEEVAVTT